MNFKSTIIVTVLFFSFMFAQGQPPIQINQFGFSQSVWDAPTRTLKVKRSGESTFITFIAMSRPPLPEWTQGNKSFNIEIEVFAKRKNSNQLDKISDNIKFTTSDFVGASTVTDVKIPWPVLTIPAGYIDESGGNIIVKWRFYKQNYPSPYNQNGWTEWFTLDHEFNLALEPIVLPPSTITGPDAICNSGTYSISNPGTVSLVNADGIATLSNLGNNQHQVNRIGQSTGTIILRSVVGGQNYDKTITVENAILNGIINGPVQFNRSQGSIDVNFEYSQPGESGNVLWSVNNTNIAVTELSNNVVRLTVLPGFTFPPGQTNVNLMVTAYKQNSCGQASVQTYIRLRNQ